MRGGPATSNLRLLGFGVGEAVIVMGWQLRGGDRCTRRPPLCSARLDPA